MLWFKLHSAMRHNPKIKKLHLKFGILGSGIYNLCLQIIVESITTDNPLPVLKESIDDLSLFYNTDKKIIKKVIDECIKLKLLEKNKKGQITCNNIYKYLEKSQTRSEHIRNLIDSYKDVKKKEEILNSLENNKNDHERIPDNPGNEKIEEISTIPTTKKSHIIEENSTKNKALDCPRQSGISVIEKNRNINNININNFDEWFFHYPKQKDFTRKKSLGFWKTKTEEERKYIFAYTEKYIDLVKNREDKFIKSAYSFLTCDELKTFIENEKNKKEKNKRAKLESYIFNKYTHEIYMLEQFENKSRKEAIDIYIAHENKKRLNPEKIKDKPQNKISLKANLPKINIFEQNNILSLSEIQKKCESMKKESEERLKNYQIA